MVPSLQLWSRAVAELSHSGKRYSRRVTVSWLCLLVGAVCAALALARPTMFTSGPARRVAVAVCPSAEIATEKGLASLRNAVAAMLDRLGGDDRVQLLLPAEYPQDTPVDWLSTAEARKRISQLKAISAAADELQFPPVESGVQHTYIITPAGTTPSGGLNTTVIELPTNLPPITLDALAATIRPDGKADIFAKIRNTIGEVQDDVALTFGSHSGRPVIITVKEGGLFQLQPGEARGLVGLLPAANVLLVETCSPSFVKNHETDRQAISVAWLVRRQRRRVRLAVVGPDEPMLRRYIESDPLLELWGDAKDADVVFINASTVPAAVKNKPALVINPAAAPAGWRRGPQKQNVVLDEADLAADDPILRDVNLAGMAVRRMTPWIAGDFPSGRPLIHIDGEAVLLRNAPAAAATAPGPRRVYVAFSLAAENTNLTVSEPFVILLANIFRWLAPAGKAEATYEWVSPLQAGGDARNWTLIEAASSKSKIFVSDPALPLPGLYRDQAGRYHAVNLVGLRSAEPKIPADKCIAEAPLPAPAHMQRGVAFWPGLVIAATALWLLGWALRFKN